MSYILNNPGIVWGMLWEHLAMTGLALLLATAIALPLGVVAAQSARVAAVVLGVLGIAYTIPSLALIIFLVPIFGLNATSVVVALVLYVQVILVRNVVAGLHSIDPAVLEAARGMGMSGWQRWWRIQLPLALPIMLAGLRVATVVAIAIATIGAKFSAGGLGQLLFEGIAQAGRADKIWAGAISVGTLALALNSLLLLLARRFDPAERVRRAQAQQREALPTLYPR